MNQATTDAVRIPVRHKGKIVAYAIVDAIDAEQAQYRWTMHRKGYAMRSIYPGGRRIGLRLHRAILGLVPGDGLQGDHIDRDKMNNRRSNLRVVTNAQNRQNLDAYRGSSSRHRGVCWHQRIGQWQAYGTVDGKRRHLGYFRNEDDAGKAAQLFRAEHMPFAVE